MSGLRVPHAASSSRVVRGRLLASLSTAGVPADVAEDVLLVATELVSNALRHTDRSQGELVVGWRVAPEGITVRVADGSDDAPTARDASPKDTSGRGMTIVDQLSDCWGVEPLGAGRPGKQVWARVPVEPVRVAQPA